MLKADTYSNKANNTTASQTFIFTSRVEFIGKVMGCLTWFGDRNSWLLSFMYMLSPSNCGQKQRGEINTMCKKGRKKRLGAGEEVRRGKALYGWPEV